MFMLMPVTMLMLMALVLLLLHNLTAAAATNDDDDNDAGDDVDDTFAAEQLNCYCLTRCSCSKSSSCCSYWCCYCLELMSRFSWCARRIIGVLPDRLFGFAGRHATVVCRRLASRQVDGSGEVAMGWKLRWGAGT
jgi:hypothetical protein